MERFFVSQLHVGRHRSSGYSAMGEIATIAARTARPAVKASALVVASGGLVAAYAVPATAAPARRISERPGAPAETAKASARPISKVVRSSAGAASAAASPPSSPRSDGGSGGIGLATASALASATVPKAPRRRC